MGFRFRKSKKAGPFRFTLSKRGIGWSVGNKYIGYSSGASGRKSLRASIPGTGISYITPLGRSSAKKRKSRRKTAEARRDTVRKKEKYTVSNTNPNTEKTPMTPEERKETVGRVLLVLRWVVCVICIIEVIAFFPSISCIFWALAAVLLLPIRKIRDFIKSKVPQKPVRVAAGVAAGIAALSLSPAPETDVEITPETDAPETAYTILAETETETEAETRAETETETKAETKTTEETEPKKPSAVNSLLAGLTAAITGMTETEPEAEAEPEKTMPETKAPEPETKADTAPPETKAPETKAPETKAPETKAPETKAPEKKPPETKAPEKTITITHKDSSLSLEMVKALEGVAAFWAPTGSKIHLDPFCWTMQGVVYAGTVEEANRVKDGGWCGSCSKGANENTKSNVNATPEVIANCYSLSDYQNQIPAEAYN